MKTIAFTMIALGLAVAALPAAAQGQTSFTLETHTEGGGGYFTLEGQSTRNPTLNAAPGETITVIIKGMDDGVHNFCVGSDCSEFVTAAGESQTFTFTAPASGTVQYYCQPHKGAGMVGTVTAGVAGGTPTATGTTNGGENESPGFGLIGALVAVAGLALVLRRK